MGRVLEGALVPNQPQMPAGGPKSDADLYNSWADMNVDDFDTFVKVAPSRSFYNCTFNDTCNITVNINHGNK